MENFEFTTSSEFSNFSIEEFTNDTSVIAVSESFFNTTDRVNTSTYFFTEYAIRKYQYELFKKVRKEKLYQPSTSIIIVLSILYASISVLSLLGNGLVIWVVAASRKMRTVTNIYIGNLAVSDVILGVFCVPFQFQAALRQRWDLPGFMCSFCPFIQVSRLLYCIRFL